MKNTTANKSETAACNKCHGTGKYLHFGVCFQCQGTGRVARTEVKVSSVEKALETAHNVYRGTRNADDGRYDLNAAGDSSAFYALGAAVTALLFHGMLAKVEQIDAALRALDSRGVTWLHECQIDSWVLFTPAVQVRVLELAGRTCPYGPHPRTGRIVDMPGGKHVPAARAVR